MTAPPSLAGASVLVTGATGFIGARLAELLSVEAGAVVTGVGRDLGRVAWLRDRGVRLGPLDLRDAHALDRVVSGVDVVFHTAGVLAGSAAAARAVNEDATEALVRSAARAGVGRFVHTSTVSVYDMPGRAVLDETAPLAYDHPAPYARTKARGERKAFEAAAAGGMELVAARPSMVYGPGPGVWTTARVRDVRRGWPVYFGDGSASFNPVFLDDVVDALVRCATAPDVAGEAFNVSADVTTWRDFMDRYAALCGREPRGLPLWAARLTAAANRLPGLRLPIDRGVLDLGTHTHRFPTEKAHARLGWVPHVGLDEGMARTLRWLRDHGYGR